MNAPMPPGRGTGDLPTGGGYTLLADPGRYELRGMPVVLTFAGWRFVPGDPFYRLVSTFVVATAGLTPIFDATHYPSFLENVHGTYTGVTTGNVVLDLRQTITEVRAGAISADDAVHMLCMQLSNSAWQLLVDYWHPKVLITPAIQVLRHIRHAASHGNRWHFKGGEPDKAAVWNKLDLRSAATGSKHPLNGKQCFGVDVGPADLLLLLHDIQRNLPPSRRPVP